MNEKEKFPPALNSHQQSTTTLLLMTLFLQIKKSLMELEYSDKEEAEKNIMDQQSCRHISENIRHFVLLLIN